MTYPITAFRNRDSVTQSFPGGDPSVLLLCAISFTEAGFAGKVLLVAEYVQHRRD